MHHFNETETQWTYRGSWAFYYKFKGKEGGPSKFSQNLSNNFFSILAYGFLRMNFMNYKEM